jgi:hypothetical protein
MMQAAEDWPGGNLARSLNRPMPRRILLQGEMCPEFVVVACVSSKNPAQMGFAKDDSVIKAFPTDPPDQPLRMSFCQGDRTAVG